MMFLETAPEAYLPFNIEPVWAPRRYNRKEVLNGSLSQAK